MRDPDILAIQRKRRQQGRCIACGAKVPWAVLCDGCSKTLAYCPSCETLHNRRPGLAARRRSDYCKTCMARYARKRLGAGTRINDLARRQEERHRLLPELIKRYKKGENLTLSARAMGLSRAKIDRLIFYARRHGEWPEGLIRQPRKGHNYGDDRGDQEDE